MTTFINTTLLFKAKEVAFNGKDVMKTTERQKKTFSFKVEAQRFIRQIRRELGLSQAELAKKMISECDQSTISNWESGKNEIPLSKFIDILLISGRDPASYFDIFGKKSDKEDKNNNDSGEVKE